MQSGELVALPEFTEWSGGKKYFKADFSSLTVNGSYRLEVALGDDTATSAPFNVDGQRDVRHDRLGAPRLFQSESLHQRSRPTESACSTPIGTSTCGADGRTRVATTASISRICRTPISSIRSRRRWSSGHWAQSHDSAPALFRKQVWSCVRSRKRSGVRTICIALLDRRGLFLHDRVRPLGRAGRGADGHRLTSASMAFTPRTTRRRFAREAASRSPRSRARRRLSKADGVHGEFSSRAISAGCGEGVCAPAEAQSRVLRQRHREHHR